MKKASTISLLLAASVFFGACRSNNSSDNSNNSNQSNSLTSTSAAGTTNTNSNAQAQQVPFPTFTDADTALNEGKKLLDANETEKAVDALKQAVKLNPDLAEAYFNLGVAYALLEKENPTSAEEEPTPTPKKATKKGKDEILPLTKSDKAFDSAARAYEKIIKKEPKNDNAYFNLGRAYNKLNKDKESEKALRQAVKLNADDTEYQTELGAILIKLSQYDEAVTILKKIIQLEPDNSHAQDLFDKADAGQKRINFGLKPKQPDNQSAKQRSKANADDDDDSAPANQDTKPIPKPSLPPTSVPAKPTPAKTAPAKSGPAPVMNKKGSPN